MEQRPSRTAMRVALCRAAHQLLGAGLDTFAYRNPHPEGSLRVFEVDHPATQEWKRRKLEEASIPVPASVTYAPVDFERQTLEEGLPPCGLDPGTPTFFSWLGVSMYLSEEAITATLGFVGAMPCGSGLVLDYAVPRSSLGWKGRLAHDALARRVSTVGEPFQTFFRPDELHGRLALAGLGSITDLGADELNARYLTGRPDGLRVSGELGRVASAERGS